MFEIENIINGKNQVLTQGDFNSFIDKLEARLDIFNTEYSKKYDISSKLESFKGIGSFLKENIKPEESKRFIENIKSIYFSISGTSDVSYGDDFNSRFNNKDFGILTVIYLLMIKCNKNQTYKIPDGKLYLVLNSAMRGNGYECFEELLAKVTDDRMLELIEKKGFTDSNESVLLALSNQVADRKDKFNMENMDLELSEFIKTKKNLLQSIPANASKEERLQIELANNAVFHVETINRAKEVNERVYNKLLPHEESLTKYVEFDNEKGTRFLEIDKAIRNRETRFDATLMELIAIEILSKINISSLQNRDICNMAFKLSRINDINEYRAAVASLVNEYPNISNENSIDQTKKI